MINTLSLREIESHADNIYEAIIVLAKRARQINDEQKQLVQRETEYDNYDDYDEDGYDTVNSDIDYPKLPKPTSLALGELLSGKLQYSYRKKDNDDESEETEEAA